MYSYAYSQNTSKDASTFAPSSFSAFFIVIAGFALALPVFSFRVIIMSMVMLYAVIMPDQKRTATAKQNPVAA